MVGEHYKVCIKEGKTRGRDSNCVLEPKRVKLGFHPAYMSNLSTSRRTFGPFEDREEAASELSQALHKPFY